MYSVQSVPDQAPNSMEQLGTKPKFWFKDSNNHRLLFKQGRINTGENWAEKAASELCELVGLPHAKYNLALWKENQGVVTETIVPELGRLVLGNEILGKIGEDYDETQKYGQSQHTVRLVMTFLRNKNIRVPRKYVAPQPVISAADVFVGYLMFDAWVGNTDRHHENWGIILMPNSVFLAPTFDHASCLGRELNDQTRIRRMDTKDEGYHIERYVERARSALYRTPKDRDTLSTIEAFSDAARMHRAAAIYWIDQIRELSADTLRQVFTEFPPNWISIQAVEFALTTLRINRDRLVEVREMLE